MRVLDVYCCGLMEMVLVAVGVQKVRGDWASRISCGRTRQRKAVCHCRRYQPKIGMSFGVNELVLIIILVDLFGNICKGQCRHKCWLWNVGVH